MATHSSWAGHADLPDSLVPHLAGSRVLVLNWRDITHPLAGGAEQYMHEIARRWVAQGVDTTWFTSQHSTQSARDTLDGIRVVRSGGTLSLYLHAAWWLRRTRGQFDAVIDCHNGIPFGW